MSSMQIAVRAAATLLLAASVSRAQQRLPAQPASPTTFTFDSDTAGKPPDGFSSGRTGSGREGSWIVRAEPDAPSPRNVLAQVDSDDTDFRFPFIVADQPELADLALEVKCKPTSGRVDQACGLVFRFRDATNYYVTRANPLEGNVRLYYVKDGSRKQLASWSGKVPANVWSTLHVEARGRHFEVHWNGTRVIQADDATFSAPGKVGLWTKADSVTLFDDLTVKPLPVP